MKNRKHPEYCLMGIVLNYPEYWEQLKPIGNIFQNALCYRIYEILCTVEKFNNQTIRDIVVTGNIHEDEYDNIYNSLFEVEKFDTYLEHVMIKDAKDKSLKIIREMLSNKHKSILEIRKDFVKIIDRLDKVGTSDIITSHEIIHEMMQPNAKPDKYIKSHIPWIDERGGYQCTDLSYIAARPSVGKTTMALNLISPHVILENKKAGIISLEMSAKSLVKILISREAEINEYRIRTGQLSPAEGARVMSATEKFYNNNIIFCEKSGNIEKIKKNCIKMIEMGAEIIYIDYIQEITGGVGGNKNDELGYICRSLKAIARDYETPIVALVQLNRDCERENRKPRKSDLKSSGDLEQSADIIILLSEKSVLSKTKITLNVDIAKYRNGQCGEIEAYFEKSLRRIIFNKE